MDDAFREFLAGELQQIREQGLFKEEWPIRGEQGREIVAGPWQSLRDLQDGAAIRPARK